MGRTKTEYTPNWSDYEWPTQAVSEFYNSQKNNPFVQRRISKNIKKQGLDFSKEFIWKTIISCLLTTQQKSGPESSVVKFLRTDPFLLNLQFCLDNLNNLDEKTHTILREFGGIRFTNKISKLIKQNMEIIERDKFDIQTIVLSFDLNNGDPNQEKDIINVIQNQIVGFGSKQTRNFLQILGVTKYEIPIDSRITNWLNKNGFPIHIDNSKIYLNREYYQYISNSIQHLCKAINIHPCELDAAIFSSYDNDGWDTDKFVF